MPGRFKIRLTKRDLEILRLVYDYRFLSSAHIRALVKGSDQWLTMRLQKLFHEGFLDRPREQGAHAFGKTNHFIYGLGRAGARALAEAFDIEFSKVEWTTKNREAKQRYIWHALMIANFRATLTLALQSKRGAELLFWRQDSELKDTISVPGKGRAPQRLIVFPDAFFGIKDDRGKRFFFLEADRSTMTSRRYLKKLKGYWHYWRAGRHKEQHQIGNFRVLTTTISTKRATNLRTVAKRADEQERGSLMFWFASEIEYKLDRPGGLLAPIWTTPADNKKHHLLE